MKLAPTFKLVDGVWHLTRFDKLKKGDIIKTFNDDEGYFKGKGVSVDFQTLRSFVCEGDPYLTDQGFGEAVWTIMCDPEDKNDNGS